MSDFSRSYEILIDAPVHDVFDYCRDPRHLFEGWPELEVTDVIMTPEGTGTKAHIVGRFAKGMIVEQIEREYTEFIPRPADRQQSPRQVRASRDGPGTWPPTRSSRGSSTPGRRHEADLWRRREGPRLVPEYSTRDRRRCDDGQEDERHTRGHQDQCGTSVPVSQLTQGEQLLETPGARRLQLPAARCPWAVRRWRHGPRGIVRYWSICERPQIGMSATSEHWRSTRLGAPPAGPLGWAGTCGRDLQYGL